MEGTPTPSQPVTMRTTGAAAADGNSPAAPSASLHCIRKPPAKPWKRPAALPIPPKVYRVDPRGFRQLVQSLTGAPTEPAPRRRQEAAPAPLVLTHQPCALLPQLPAASQPVQAYIHGGASLPSSSSTTEFPLGLFSAGEAAAATATAEPPPVNDGADYQSQAYTAAGIPSPSLYSTYLTWCNMPLLSPGSMACLEQSTVL